MIKDRVKRKIATYVKANCKKIDPEQFVLGEINYTHRCHLNAVQKVREDKASKVFSCVAIDKDDNTIVIVHFINQAHDGKYVDNTWGWMHELYDYYIIKEINEEEQNVIWRSLVNTKEMLFNLNTNWFERLFTSEQII
ncbi:hypothetical protein L8C07_06290 [Paenibacillus sp. CMAA1739]|uniref:hypothetical protein n=1 Tax=Paenibacillus ottowii TaxID=2315729 RepID=UPI002DBB535E|nr:hypothetical protein [Paenibacillus sp. CMAA1739]MEC4565550.1 hypothetical protein [Paenibacillus sp. CMAA1739]